MSAEIGLERSKMKTENRHFDVFGSRGGIIPSDTCSQDDSETMERIFAFCYWKDQSPGMRARRCLIGAHLARPLQKHSETELVR